MAHKNEMVLREGYACFARGDVEGFLGTCADHVTFTVPGTGPDAGQYTKATFMDMVTPLLTLAGGTFREEIIDLVANDDHGVVLLVHSYDKSGEPVSYRTAHVVTFRDGKIASWAEWPGDEAQFSAAHT